MAGLVLSHGETRGGDRASVWRTKTPAELNTWPSAPYRVNPVAGEELSSSTGALCRSHIVHLNGGVQLDMPENLPSVLQAAS